VNGSGRDFALLTDLYELTMMQAYYAEGMTDTAVFDLSVRTLPPQRNFLLAAGLADVLDYLETLTFDADALAYLASLGTFSADFLTRLESFRFTGSVWAMPEGTVTFAVEPLLEVIAPLPEAQLIETYLLNQVTFQTAVASKAARCVMAAEGRPVIDFGARRTHGTDAAIKAARATYLAGFAATSNVLAGQRYGIPVTGTMAHSYVQSHDSEREAFEMFTRQYSGTTLLVDTYDTEEGIRTAIEAVRAAGDSTRIRALRLDSGELDALAHRARALLDNAGMHDVGVVVSGGLDEHAIAHLVAAGAPITSYAVGTRVGTSSDAPTLDSVYKLVEYAGHGRAKFSADKATLPGRKQVFREYAGNEAAHDYVAAVDERVDGTPLLVEVMRDGRRLSLDLSLDAAREGARASLGALPKALRGLDAASQPYNVEVSPRLLEMQERLRPDPWFSLGSGSDGPVRPEVRAESFEEGRASLEG
jgi:nicotinate phosphoribosyltransferase